MLKTLSTLPFLFMLTACTSHKEDYINWVQDYSNGLHIKKVVNDIEFDLQFQPSEYIAILQGEASHQNNSIQQYLLTISIRNSEKSIVDYKSQSPEDKQKILYYLSYQFQNDISLEEDGENFPCVLYHFESNADLKNSRKFVLGFEKPSSKSGEAKFIIHSEWFDSLPIIIKVNKE